MRKESVQKNYQLLKASEGCATCNEESTVVQLPEITNFIGKAKSKGYRVFDSVESAENDLHWLPDPIVFDGVPIPDREREVVATGLRVSDQKSSVLVLLQKELLLRLYPLDLPKIPPEMRKMFENLVYN